MGHHFSVHVLAADNEAFPLRQGREQVFHGMEKEHALRRLIIPISCKHIVHPSRQHFGQAFKGLPSHNDGMAHGEGFEPFQIIGKVPDEAVILPDDPVCRPGCDDGKSHTDTSMAILS